MSGSWPPNGLRFVAQRERDPHADLVPTIAQLAGLVATWAGSDSLTLAGPHQRAIGTGLPGIAAYLQDVREARARGEIEVFSLTDHAEPQAAMLFYDWEERPQLALERVWAPGPPGGIPPDRTQQSIALAGEIGEVFDAATVFTEDFSLMRLTR
ncbi:MAG TPA: hypothetical protein VK891_06290, partial [Euzebyales bacterium]|nr:hypothetical protein [Euzebyales bacterium]